MIIDTLLMILMRYVSAGILCLTDLFDNSFIYHVKHKHIKFLNIILGKQVSKHAMSNRMLLYLHMIIYLDIGFINP